LVAAVDADGPAPVVEFGMEVDRVGGDGSDDDAASVVGGAVQFDLGVAECSFDSDRVGGPEAAVGAFDSDCELFVGDPAGDLGMSE
jgi:hypothetical protein